MSASEPMIPHDDGCDAGCQTAHGVAWPSTGLKCYLWLCFYSQPVLFAEYWTCWDVIANAPRADVNNCALNRN